MTRRLSALLAALCLTGSLVACGGDGDGDAADDPSTTPDSSQSPTDEPTDEPSDDTPEVLPVWEDQLCAGLPLDDVAAALGKPTKIVNDLVAGDDDPIVRGSELAHPYCNLASGPVSAELIVNTLDPGTPLLADIKAGLQAVSAAGFLECGKPAATEVVTDHEAYAYVCQGPQGTIGNVSVAMAPDWGLNCAVTGGTQDEQEAIRVGSEFCAVAVAALVG